MRDASTELVTEALDDWVDVAVELLSRETLDVLLNGAVEMLTGALDVWLYVDTELWDSLSSAEELELCAWGEVTAEVEETVLVTTPDELDPVEEPAVDSPVETDETTLESVEKSEAALLDVVTATDVLDVTLLHELESVSLDAVILCIPVLEIIVEGVEDEKMPLETLDERVLDVAELKLIVLLAEFVVRLESMETSELDEDGGRTDWLDEVEKTTDRSERVEE